MKKIFNRSKKKILSIFRSLNYDKNFDTLCKKSIEDIK